MSTKQVFDIEGMTCASCVAHVEKSLKDLDGVSNVSVNLMTHTASLHMEDNITNEQIIKAVEDTGYKAHLKQDLKTLKLDVEGMTCASCTASIEHALSHVEGVEQVHVNLMSETVQLSYNPQIIKSQDIIKSIEEVGYKAFRSVEKNIDLDKKVDNKDTIKLVMSLVLAAVILYIAMGPMLFSQLPMPSFLSNPMSFALVQVLITIPVVIIYKDIFIRGFRTLVKKRPNMDSLVALGTTSAILYSFYGIYRIYLGDVSFAHHLYFESATVILALIGLGKYMEEVSKRKTTSAIHALLNLKPKTATLIKNGVETEVDVDEIVIGDVLVVRPGESIPMDGLILEGSSSLDEAMLTGESMPVDKTVDDEVIMGTLNINGRLLIKATVDNENTKLSQIVRMVEDAQTEKAPIAKIADTVALYFVPVVMFIALVSGIVWYLVTQDIEFSLTIFVTVLVIACPCALGLATPTAIMVGTGVGAASGIFMKSAEALETLSHTDIVVFDKTGTLTHGKPVVTDIINYSIEDHNLLKMVASLENYSEHPLARAIVNHALDLGIELEDVESFKAILGRGVLAYYRDDFVLVGNEHLMHDEMIEIKEAVLSDIQSLAQEGKTAMIVAVEDEIVGLIAVADSVKDEAKAVVDALHEMHIEVAMLTGDHADTAKSIANSLGIDRVIAEVLPDEKANHIQALQADGKHVVMVGDGINDAVALVQANVGVAIGTGTDVAVDSAKVVLMKEDLNILIEAIRLSKATITNIKQNLFWAFAYNVIGIPFAAGLFYALFNGPLLNPMIAGAAMAFSSVSVVLNALRLRRFKFRI